MGGGDKTDNRSHKAPLVIIHNAERSDFISILITQ
ncbi:Uncharacterised protein [Yersinia mollaretii]|nr:Uncharacterised protein [Yersinia mollaretii]